MTRAADHGDRAADVLIAGGGVAALEALMALRALAGERARVTLLSPEPDFVHRPQSVGEPFGLGAPLRLPLAQLTADFGAGLRRAGVAAVDAVRQRIALRSGDTLGYDVLVLAPGARTLPAFEDAVTFGGPGAAATMRALLADLEGGEVGRIAFVAPTLAGWTLPLYELALLTARHAAHHRIAAELVLVTPEATPLQAFGAHASERVGGLLAAAGVEFAGGQSADTVGGALRLQPSGRTLEGRVVALPLVRGPRIDGIPSEPPFGFIPVDDHGRVRGLPHVYAAGDATHHLVKQGGLAAQQADAVAAHIAAGLGAPVLPEPYRPVLRGVLETGDERHVLHDDGEPAKLAGRHLAPYLDALQPAT